VAKKRSIETAHDVFRVSLGWCAAARNERGICAFVLPMSDERAAEAEVLRRFPAAPRRRLRLRALREAAQRYFDGWTVRFDEFPVDLSGGTPFQQRVWSVVRRIPYGQVRTYRWIGMEMGQPEAARAIGAAVGANPVPLLVPCHRVVAADGSLCGFSAEGGIDLKAKMLELERVRLWGHDAQRKVLVR